MGHRVRNWDNEDEDFFPEPEKGLKSTIKAVFTTSSGFAKIHNNFLSKRGNKWRKVSKKR